jgi:hypothetical protein
MTRRLTGVFGTRPSPRGLRWRAVGAILVLLLASCGGGNTRPPRSTEQLLEARAEADREVASVHESIVTRYVTHMKARQDDHAAGRTDVPPVIDFLIISGGGDWGAFGAGFLKGWGRVPPGPMARPQFDAVTGVSTGALIAPFAFLGDEESFDTVVRLYRNPKKDWVRPRGVLSLFRGDAAYADIPGLERDLRHAVDVAMLRRIGDAGAEGRVLAVSATNIDTEEVHVFDLVEEARTAAAAGDTRRMRRILLASAAVPGVFPPREIGPSLYVDGGVTGNILHGIPHNRRPDYTFFDRWRETYPDAAPPKVRYWVIFNNELRWAPEVVQPRWSSVLKKSLTASTRAATVNSMRQLFLQAELARLKHGADVEVRVAAVPDGWVAPGAKPFDKKTMNALADLGEQMGADPASWRTEPP